MTQAHYKTFLVADEDNRRNYRDRQLYANQRGADVYIEFHFNARAYDKVGVQDNPASCLVSDNASRKSRQMASDFAATISREFGYPNKGLVVLKKGDRAYYNLYYTQMKAFLIEPFYVSDAEQAAVALSEEGQRQVAAILADVIRSHYPMGCTIACSLGHKFKRTQIHDRGAPVVIGVDDDEAKPVPVYHPKKAEADLAERVMEFFISDIEERKTSSVEEPKEVILTGDWKVCPLDSERMVLRKT